MNFNSKTILSLSALMVLISTYAIAGPKYSTETIYFSDASKTKTVGELTLSCSGSTYAEGQVTSYFTVFNIYECPKSGRVTPIPGEI